MPDTARDIALDCCVRQHGRLIDLHLAVVMPDHVHLLLTTLRGRSGAFLKLPEIMHVIKGTSGHEINKAMGRQGPVWQDESFDHVLRSQESLAEKVQYVCQNPVRAGLVEACEQYRWVWRGEIPNI